MSAESKLWLHTKVLYADEAWHRDEQFIAAEGIEDNRYVGVVPVEDVYRRLFNWEPVEAPVTTGSFVVAQGDNLISYDPVYAPKMKHIVRLPGSLGPDDRGAILGTFSGAPNTKKGYRIHGYGETLVEMTKAILDAGNDTLAVRSAGLLAEGARAWVQVTLPETMKAPGDVEFLPNLLAATSLDGSLATTFKRTITNVVCDNTMAAALGEHGSQVKVKHSRNSLGKLSDLRDSLSIVLAVADDFCDTVEHALGIKVSDKDFDRFLESLAPTKEKGEEKTGRGYTMARNKQDALRQLWNADDRVEPWKNTGWGVIQAVNTYAHHIQGVKVISREERNMDNAVRGVYDLLDQETLTGLEKVLATA